jgi:hypothetical protein
VTNGTAGGSVTDKLLCSVIHSAIPFTRSKVPDTRRNICPLLWLTTSLALKPLCQYFDIEELLHDDEKSREAFYAHDESFDQFALCLRSGGRREDNRHLHHRILML